MKITGSKKTRKINLILFEELFYQVSPEIAATFTKEQIEAIAKSFQHRDWHQHSIDRRISVSIFRLRFYLVLLAGEERRSKLRLQYEKSLYPLWTPRNIFFLIIFSLISIHGIISTLFLIKSLISTKLNLAFPTSIPGIENQNDCEQFNRTWKDNECWDNQHSPSF
jgi:hypothetical protein